jgi:hypothetical protein
MRIKVTGKRITNISKTPVLQQTSFWAQVKRRHGVASKAFDLKVDVSSLGGEPILDDYVRDDMLVLFPNVGGDYRIGYVPYGPTLRPGAEHQGLFLEELSEALRPHLPPKCAMLRYDLLWESPWAGDNYYYDEKGNWMGPPSKANQEIRLNFDTHGHNLRKANTNVLPSDTIFVDLTKDGTRLLREMRPKTRYNVGLSQRKGVRVRRADASDLDTWYALYSETCKRNSIYLHKAEYFKAVFATRTSDAKSQAEVELLIAELGDIPLAAMFLVVSAKRATYLYGASSSIKRNHMATYALQWEAMRRAKQKGCTEYDMFGVAPRPDPSHPLYGLYRFKKGFGGSVLHRMGCWDYPLSADTYEQYLAAEMQSQGYHLH